MIKLGARARRGAIQIIREEFQIPAPRAETAVSAERRGRLLSLQMLRRCVGASLVHTYVWPLSTYLALADDVGDQLRNQYDFNISRTSDARFGSDALFASPTHLFTRGTVVSS